MLLLADGILMRFDEDINDELLDDVDVDVVVVVFVFVLLLFNDGCKCLCCERNELPIDEMRSSVARLFSWAPKWYHADATSSSSCMRVDLSFSMSLFKARMCLSFSASWVLSKLNCCSSPPPPLFTLLVMLLFVLVFLSGSNDLMTILAFSK